MDRRSLLTFAAAGAAILVSGCVGRADPALRPWHEVRTDRVVLVTDLDRDDARDLARELDGQAAALSDLYGLISARRPAPLQPVRVVHLAGCDELRRIHRADVAGFVDDSADFGDERLIVTCESGQYRSEVTLHELTHALNHRYFSALPAWLEEGLATYYQTLVLERDKAIVGRPPEGDLHRFSEVARLPSMDELRAMTGTELMAASSRRGYFAAWKLTHLLATASPDHTRRFQRFLAGLATSEDEAAAFSAAFGDVKERVARDYGSYHLRRALNVRHIPYRAAGAGGIVAERRLRAGEAHALWLELEFVRRDPAGLRERLARMDRDDPTWSRRAYWHALVHWRLQTAGVSPAAMLRDHVGRHPRDAQGWLGLVLVEIQRLVPSAQIGEAGVPELAELEDEVRGLLRFAMTPVQLDYVGWYYALRRQPKIGLNFTLRALAAEPGCNGCWDTLALLYFEAGRIQEAIAAERRAIGLSGDGRVPFEFKRRLRRYEEAAARARRDR